MRQSRRWQRIFILSLLFLSVVAPLIFLSHRLQLLTPSHGPREFFDDLSTVTYRTDPVLLNAIEQEGAEEIQEPKEVVYKEIDFDSAVSYSGSGKNNSSEESRIEGFRSSLLERNGFDDDKRQDQEARQNGSSSVDGDKKKFNTTLTHNQNTQTHSQRMTEKKSSLTATRNHHTSRSQSQRVTYQKVGEIKDQIIRARAYLGFFPPNSNSHLLKELKLRIKEMERAVRDAIKDSDLSRSALQKMRHMEASLSKANRAFPDCTAMATKLRAMNHKAEEQVRSQQRGVTHLVHLAARTTPKGLHCLSMQLTSDFFALRPEDRKLPDENKIHNPKHYHYAVFSDNILACAVVVNSTVSNAKKQEKLVFHVVTNSLNFPAISMWFLLNPPDIFPTLNKILLFDHDVVVQKDLSELWNVNMNGKVIAGVGTCQKGETSFHRMDMFINFSDPFIAKRFDVNACTWAFGMNLFDLQQWKRHDLTAVYHKYLEMGAKMPLLNSGSLPLGWLTFYEKTLILDRRWHILGLGYDSIVDTNEIERAAVIHYDGIRKPWLDIAVGRYKSYWTKFMKFDLPILQRCNLQA